MLKKILLSAAFLSTIGSLQAQEQTLCDACTEYFRKVRSNIEYYGRPLYKLSCIYPNEKLMCNLTGIKSYTFSRLRKGEPPVNVAMTTDALEGSTNGKHLLITFKEGDILVLSDIKAVSKSGNVVTIKSFSLKITEKNSLQRYQRVQDRWIELSNILPEMKDLDKSKIQITSFLVNGEEFKTAGFDANLISDDANISKVKATYMGKPLPVADFVWKWE